MYDDTFRQLLINAGVENIPNFDHNHEGFQRFGKNDRYYVKITDDFCYFGDWTGQIAPICWFSDRIANRYNSCELKQKQEEYGINIEQDLQQEYEIISKRAADLWDEFSDKGDSLYLQKKGLNGVVGIKYGALFIVIKMIDNQGKIWSLQYICDDGKKFFLKGGMTKGCYSEFGNKEAGTLFVCEGLATGLSILKAKPDSLVIVAYGCHNLKSVVVNIKNKYNKHNIVIAGDNDVTKPDNIGKQKAEEVAKEFGLRLVLPQFRDISSKPSDFNDLYLLEGLDELCRQLDTHTETLVVYNVAEFLKIKLQAIDYVIEPILPIKGLVMIYAKRGIGKTYFALHLACSIAGGADIFDGKWKVIVPRSVLYIDGEMPANVMQDRMQKLMSNYDIQNPDNLRIITSDTQEYSTMPNLSTGGGQESINAVIMKYNIDAIVIDNISTLCRSGKENDAEFWIPVQAWLLNLRKKGKAVILIHHAGKADVQRGTSKKEDVLDTVIRLSRPEDYRQEDGARFEVHFEKSRGFYGKDAEPFETMLVTNNDGLEWTTKDIEDVRRNKIAELKSRGLSYRDIAKQLGCSPATVSRALNKLSMTYDDGVAL